MSWQSVQAYYRQLLEQQGSLSEQAIEQAYQHTLASITPRLDALYREIAALQAQGETVPVEFLYEQRRLQLLKLWMTEQIDHFGLLSQLTVQQLQQAGIDFGNKSAQEMLNSLVPRGIQFSFGVPMPDAILRMVEASQNGPLARLFSGFGKEAADKAANALIAAITHGDNPRTIADSVAAALQIPRYRALTIARTEMLNAYRGAQLANYQANSDVVGGWIWSAALSPRTCAACIAMNGTEHPLSEPMNSHPNCRCSPVPKTNSWADILGPLGIDTSNIPETSVQIPSGSAWFNDQSAATQLAILGPGKYAAFVNGTLNLSDLVGYADGGVYEKSLKELGV